jgi:hypothetical protein
VRAMANPDLGLVMAWVRVMVRVMAVPGRAKVLVKVLVTLGWVKELHCCRHWFHQAPAEKLCWSGHPLRKTRRRGWLLGLGQGRCWLLLLCSPRLPKEIQAG